MKRRFLPGSALMLALAVLLLAPAPARANPIDEPMVFTLAHSSKHGFTWISAAGEITLQTPSDFQRFVKTLDPGRKGLWIEFHSPGGLVGPALHLGALIRDGGFKTDVGRTILRGDGRDELAPGACFSACGFAFLGGVRRAVQEDSALGYHRFYRLPGTKIDAKRDEIESAEMKRAIAAYLRYMGIGEELLSLTMATDPWDHYEPDEDKRVELRIVTEVEGEPEPGAEASVEPAPKAKPAAASGALGKQS
jgi:hypothetical protein